MKTMSSTFARRRAACGAIILAIILLLVVPAPAEKDSSGSTSSYAPKKYKKSIMDKYGGHSSPMSSDRKVIIETPDGVVIAQEIYSPNKRFTAFSDLKSQSTKITETVPYGNYGRMQNVWSMDGFVELLGLSNDGMILITGNPGDNLIPDNTTEDRVMLTFYDRGELFAEVKLDQIITDLSKLQKIEDGYYWGDYWGLNVSGHYVIKTVEGNLIQFDIITGKVIEPEIDAEECCDDWLIYRDIMRGYQYQYIAGYELKESLNWEGRPTGETFVTNKATKWGVQISVEDFARSSLQLQSRPSVSFEEFVVDLARLMSSADGPHSSHYATDIISLDTFYTANNLKCAELYIMGVHETYYEGEETQKKETPLGPFYAVQLSAPDEPYRTLFFRIGYGDTPTQEDALAKEMANTVRAFNP